jgi:predicted metal-dependent HD superfamily phosphohydrolase
MLRDRFTSLWLRMAARTDVDAAYALIERSYGAARRHYHNLEHIASCLDDFALVRHLTEKPERVEFALWYHDVVYDITRDDNVAQSAALAGEVGAAAGLTEDCLQEVVELILATKHDAPPSTVPQQIIVDVDLAILASRCRNTIAMKPISVGSMPLCRRRTTAPAERRSCAGS